MSYRILRKQYGRPVRLSTDSNILLKNQYKQYLNSESGFPYAFVILEHFAKEILSHIFLVFTISHSITKYSSLETFCLIPLLFKGLCIEALPNLILRKLVDKKVKLRRMKRVCLRILGNWLHCYSSGQGLLFL